MTLIIDASVAVQWVVPGHHTWAALALRADALYRGESLRAPALFAYEVTSVLRGSEAAGLLTRDEARAALNLILDTVTLYPAVRVLSRRALEIAGLTAQRSAYDAHYIALAESEGCDYWTDDAPLVHAARGAFPFVRWIGAFAPPPSV